MGIQAIYASPVDTEGWQTNPIRAPTAFADLEDWYHDFFDAWMA